ncbi:hypothetical protein Ancab_011010 [Ancistrocladus abbreviatus]
MVERDGSAKGIVFSQFTSFLDLINYSLQKFGINCVQLVGSMTMTARDAAITRFTEDADCRIFLMSLKAGGVALNLTVTSHVSFLDGSLVESAAVERQAQDRMHRIGQYKPIRMFPLHFNRLYVRASRILEFRIMIPVSCFLVRNRIVRFVIENTIEERILKLQEKKELVFEGYVSFVYEWAVAFSVDCAVIRFNNLTVLNRTVGGSKEARWGN